MSQVIYQRSITFAFSFFLVECANTRTHFLPTLSLDCSRQTICILYRHQLLFVISAARVMPTSLFLFLFLCRHKRPSGFFTICPCLSLWELVSFLWANLRAVRLVCTFSGGGGGGGDGPIKKPIYISSIGTSLLAAGDWRRRLVTCSLTWCR